jgi:flagellar hook protein FlgE
MEILSMNISSTLSGMNAAQNLLQASAQNIANVTRQDAAQVPGAQVAGARTSSALRPASPSLETSMVQQLQAKNDFLANLKVFKTNNEMLGNLFDISA